MSISLGSLGGAPQAHADAGSDFLAKVSEYGFDVGAQGEDVYILAHAATLCGYLHHGFSPEQASMYIHYQYPDATPQQLAGFAEAAQTTLCEAVTGLIQPAW